APGGRAVEDDEVPGPGRGGPRQPVGGKKPDAHRVDEHVVAVGVVEDGRAAIAMMSRRIPPTPVAAPWNGSTAEGWLWLSTLKQTASPSPRSRTPAFSPGPCKTRLPVEGSRFSRRAECLY